jgi:hypothetical protein
VLVEVQASLIVNERLGWLLPVYFCVGALLTAIEVITKVSDAFRILKMWSDAKTCSEVEWSGAATATVVIQ